MYGDDITLILSDTDSLVYVVFTEDGYRDLYSLREHMDLSQYSETGVLAPYRNTENISVPGKFKDERPNEIIKEVIALKPKMYSIDTKVLECPMSKHHTCKDSCFHGHSVTAKGISKAAKKTIRHEDYKSVLDTRNTMMTRNRAIRSYNHRLFSISVDKWSALRPFGNNLPLFADF